ncbi:trypsin-like peptidase domain-containing protein [Virgibacillus sp. NKC19-16]|uniref:S1C family serine protease n=1 Tax=Virgibacillus salidurans TaxID=2831673 RepID=UPI001F240A27|nr:trypsin-like peptidase domain-containing protein [Virgibacillus sp. NKC19-16]UJL46375.1 trypsin-like peptidase domain-containing protein [Virgibacillus sp. NKC19-16]
MGYYNRNYPPNPHRNSKKKRGWLVPAMLGVIIGILLVVVALPALSNSNFLPDQWAGQADNNNNSNDEANIQTYDEGNNVNTSVNVDVSTQITEVVEEVTPAVVGVINIQRQGDFWQQQEESSQAGTGSGVIYKVEDGTAFVVTNQHVVQGADTVEVVLSDDTRIEAEILGGDLFSDLAVLRMDGSEVQGVAEIGSSENIKVGEPAIAIGNPLGMMFSSSVTQGVISGTQRTIPQDFNQDGRADWQAEVIQTDAAINPGNSGGALINISGQLIGINSMKVNQAAVEGIGFAIPIDAAMPTIQELEATGEVTRPYLGVEIYSLDEVPQSEWNNTLNLPEDVEGGVYVWSVEPLSPADEAGMEQLDVITQLDGEPVMNMIDLRKILYQEKEIGDEVVVTYYRDGEQAEATIELGSQ